MSRLRSPSHPNSSLPDAIEYARKIHGHERRNPVSREVAVQHMGFSGLSGTSDRALATILHYGLAEKAAKGEVKVSDLAVRIIHPDHQDEFKEAIREAAFNPSFFAELRKRYPGEPPSVSSLSSYLSRSGFATASIGPAAKAYIETCQFLRQERAYESDVPADDDDAESVPLRSQPEPKPMLTASLPTAFVPPVAYANAEKLNDLSMDIRGSEVTIHGRLDLVGLKELKAKIELLEGLLKPVAEKRPSDEPDVML